MISVHDIRLYNILLREIEVHAIKEVEWSKVWAISHVWDNLNSTSAGIKGCTWESTAFSDVAKCRLLIERASKEAISRGGTYLWMDSICVNQECKKEKEEQIPHMRKIFSESLGTIAFGPVSNKFSSVLDQDWVNVWFERVWTYQEMQLPKTLIFVSEDKVFTRRELYWLVLLASPYLNRKNINDILNGMSRGAMLSTNRALIQANKRSSSLPIDKIYGVLAAMDQHNDKIKNYIPNYQLNIKQATIEIMKFMSHKDIMDILTLNLESNNLTHDDKNWSGMISIDKDMDHPSYGNDIYYGENAHIHLQNNFMYTSVNKIPIWKCKMKELPVLDTETTLPQWPSMNNICNLFGIKLNFNHSNIEHKTIDRALRSINANIKKDEISEEIFIMASKLLDGITPDTEQPKTRIGVDLKNININIMLCRSKKNKLFHYGICITKNTDDTWHKICTIAFREEDMDILEKREEDVTIGA